MIGIAVLALVLVVFVVIMKVCERAGEDWAARAVLKEIGLQYGEKLNTDSAYKEAFNQKMDEIFKRDSFRKAIGVLLWSSELFFVGLVALTLNIVILVLYGETENQIMALAINILMLIMMATLVAASRVTIFRMFAEADAAGEWAKFAR